MAAELTIEQHKQLYEQIVALYDLTENILDTLDSPLPSGSEADETLKELRLKLALPVIEKAQVCADAVGNIYMQVLEEKRKPTQPEIKTVEKSIRSVFNEILEYTRKLAALPTYHKV